MPPTNEREQRPISIWRSVVVLALFLVGLSGLGARLIYLQTQLSPDFTELADRQQIAHEVINARPGTIMDRKGRVLATTLARPSLFAVPANIKAPEDFVSQLALCIDLKEDSVSERIRKHSDKQFLWLRRRIDPEQALLVKSLELAPNSFGFRDEYSRIYPQGDLAAHVLGLRNIDGVGQSGLEKSFAHVLDGTNGKRHYLRDARGRVVRIDAERSTEVEHGADLTSTIDIGIQMMVETRLDQLVDEWAPRGACAIVMQPATGEILALVSRPGFDPRAPDPESPEAWKNLTIAASFEPGSTFKPLIVAWAMEQGMIDRDETFNCERGAYRMGPRVLHDHHSYGDLSVTDILVKSSNIGMAKIGERMTNAGLYDAARAFGFGVSTGIELPGEINGTLRPLEDWTLYSTGSIPMGQELSATPLQIVTAISALANDGELIQPRIVKRVGHEDLVPTRSLIVSRDVADWVVQVPMRQVVERGTGKAANLPEYSVFGKTGTAQKYDAELGRYSHSKVVCSFVCGAPAANPQAVVIVSVDEPSRGGGHYGGTVAAPAAAEILRETLKLLGVPREHRVLRLAM